LRADDHRPGEQVGDFPFEHVVGRDADGVLIVFVFKKSVTTPDWQKAASPRKSLGDVVATIPVDHRQQQLAARTGAVMMTATEASPVPDRRTG